VNEPVRFSIKNEGGHTLTVDELGLNIALNGPSAVATFTPKKKGTFRMYCAVPGHAGAGMVGTMIVE
jgi:plastocyanin